MRRKILSLLIACAMVASVGSTALTAGAVETASKSAVEIHESKSRQGLIDATYGDFEYSYIDPSMMAGKAAYIEKYTGKSSEVEIPSEINGFPVVELSSNSFKDCTSLKTVTISDGISSINKAFTGCVNLEKLVIPKSVTRITDTFSDCTNLTIYGYSDSYAENYCIQNIINFIALDVDEYGFKCEDLPDGTKKLLKYNGRSSNVVISDDISIIGSGAFNGCTNLIDISIPDSVTYIGNEAFKGCTGLTNITIPDSVTFIGNSAFDGSGLINITIPDSVTSIGNFAFSYCTSLTSITIPDSVTSMGDGIFCYCSNLESVSISNNVKHINEFTFSKCINLKKVNIPNGITFIDSAAFWNCNSLTSINIPNSVTSIGINAFEGCTNLTNVVIPSSTTNIGGGAFRNCPNLTNIYIPDKVSEIDNCTFEGCTGLIKVRIPENVTSINYNAFYNCKSLKKIYIPNSVISFDNTAFAKCENLTIYGEAGSAAETYANQMDIPFLNTAALSINDIYDLELYTLSLSIKGKTSDSSGSSLTVKSSNAATEYTAAYDPETDKFIFDYTPKANDHIVITVTSKFTDKIVKTYEHTFTQSEIVKGANGLAVAVSKNTTTDNDGKDVVDLDLDVTSIVIDKDSGNYTDSDTKKDTDKGTESDIKKDPDTTNKKIGDLDDDGKITSADALFVLRASVKLEKLDDVKTKLADVDGDGEITSSDSLAILRYSVGFRDKGILIQ